MTFPKVASEEETLRLALEGRSLSRFGDGELRLAARRSCISQIPDANLAKELCEILKSPAGDCLPCIPNFQSKTPKTESWARYATDYWLSFYGPGPFGSSFITRPDSAPWIDTDGYWSKVEGLWRDKDVTLVYGTPKSLRPDMMTSAASIRCVETPRRDAYAEIDRIEDEIGTPSGPVLMCVGPTASALAWRLSKKGVHALDLGHIGQFMRSAGAYRYTLDDLCSKPYRELLDRMHLKQKGWGSDGAKHAAAVTEFAAQIGAETIQDYGCGAEALAKALSPVRVMGFDPGIPAKSTMPKPVDLVVSTDCLEHVEQKKLGNVLDHIVRLAHKGVYLVIATRLANAKLPDGSNAHKLVFPASWWIERISQLAVAVERYDIRGDKEVAIWLRKR